MDFKPLIKNALINYNKLPYFEKVGLAVLSKQYPNGEKSFWENEKYKRLEQIKSNTIFLGSRWINSDCPDIKDFMDLISENVKAWFNKPIYTKYMIEQDIIEDAKEEIDLFFRLYFEYCVINKIIANLNQSTQITIPDHILSELENEGFIEDKTANPLKWLKNKQYLRELLTHDKIRDSLTKAEVERIAPTLFMDKKNKPLELAKNRQLKGGYLPPDYKKLLQILATL